METLETVFDINRILVTLFNTSAEIRKEKNIDLVYQMDAHVPKELRGDSTVLLRLLTQMLTFIFEHSDRKEILLSLTAPVDFLFEEDISFRIRETGIRKEKVLAFLETKLSKDLETLGAKIVYKDDDFSDVSLSIPFKVNELGFRRHYRLPDNKMLDQKVLIICESTQVSKSIKKLFQYFNYNVDVGIDVFKQHESDLGKYDIFLTEEKFYTGELGPVIKKAEGMLSLKLVILKGKEKIENSNIHSISTYLSKPITQESIYNLIVELFNQEVEKVKSVKREVKPRLEPKTDPKTEPKPVKENMFRDTIEAKRTKNDEVLNVKFGKDNAKKHGLVYHKVLQNFLDTFDRSDLYFREIVQEKATTKIKDFCIDLEKQSKMIGAESMLNFVDIVSLIFVYNKLDMLPIYPGRYHIELQKLLAEIRKQL